MDKANTQRLENLSFKQSKDTLKFSYFKNAKATKKTKDLSEAEYLAIVSDPNRQTEAERLRALPIDEYKKAKLLQPCITGSCIMDSKGRSKSNIESLNGFVVVDLDILPAHYANWGYLKDDLILDPFTFIVHYSLSKRGLCVFVKVEMLNIFKEIYLSLAEYYLMNFGAKIDFLADETRLRFISYDAKPFYNPNSEIYTHTIKEEPQEPKEVEDFDLFASLSKQDPATTLNNSGAVGAELIISILEERGWSSKKGAGKEAFVCTRPGGQDRSLVILNNEDVFKVSVLSSNTGIAETGVYNFFEFYKKLTGFDDYNAQRELANLDFGVFNESSKNEFPIKVFPEPFRAYAVDLRDTLNFPID